MKLLRVISSLDPSLGGPVEGAFRIDSRLKKLGHNIEVVSLDTPGQHFLDHYPIKVHALGPSKLHYSYCRRLIPWLKKHHHNYSAVLVNGIWQFHSFAAWWALSGTATPYFVFTHGMLDPWFRQHYPLKHLKKWLYWPWADYRVLRDAAAVIFTSEEERLLARKSFWLYKCTEEVTSYGTDSPPAGGDTLARRFLSHHPGLEGKRLVLFLGRIHEKKGCDMLLEAFAAIAGAHPDLHLVMAGPDSSGWTAGLKQQAARLNVAGKITWTGMLQGDVKWGAYYAADVFALPSHQENFGIAVAEALATGTPVLISDKVNIWREVRNGQAGFVDADTVDGTRRNLEAWLAQPAPAQAAMTDRAERCFLEHFHMEKSVATLLDILERHT